jgi:hypothetical protein
MLSVRRRPQQQQQQQQQEGDGDDDAPGRSGVTVAQLRGGGGGGGMDGGGDDAELEEGEACGDDTAFVDPDVALSYIVSRPLESSLPAAEYYPMHTRVRALGAALRPSGSRRGSQSP